MTDAAVDAVEEREGVHRKPPHAERVEGDYVLALRRAIRRTPKGDKTLTQEVVGDGGAQQRRWKHLDTIRRCGVEYMDQGGGGAKCITKARVPEGAIK